MTRVLVASMVTGESDLSDFLWPMSTGPSLWHSRTTTSRGRLPTF